jgi:DNA-binding CsgD family transcriptional regulator
LLNSTRLLFDLQRGNEIAQSFSGCLEPETIARQVTDGLVEKFDCAFARIWLLEPDQTVLRLVASSGMYTHINGSFARVPMGAYKVGKIAQNRVSFLSNNLAEESWVKDREWAIANNIRGFAGYPLTLDDRVIGVLAIFSHQAMAPEFLEILQLLCTTVTVGLDTALKYQKEKQRWHITANPLLLNTLPLSDQLASILKTARLTLVGTEQPLSFSLSWVFLRAAEVLNKLECSYCRLTYSAEAIALEAIITSSEAASEATKTWIRSAFGELLLTVAFLGGVLHNHVGINQKLTQILLRIPYPTCVLGLGLRIQCQSSVLQTGFTHIAYLAGLTVFDMAQDDLPLLTDDVDQIQPGQPVLWIKQRTVVPPVAVQAQVELSITPTQLRNAVEAVLAGKTWGCETEPEPQSLLSEREREIMTLLANGLRDRDIANKLMISESTVKFHINNTLSKLKVRNRYQALHEVTVNGWIS